MLAERLAWLVDFTLSAAVVTLVLCAWFGYRNEAVPPFRRHFAGLYPWSCAYMLGYVTLRWSGLPPWAAMPVAAVAVVLVVVVATRTEILAGQRERGDR